MFAMRRCCSRFVHRKWHFSLNIAHSNSRTRITPTRKQRSVHDLCLIQHDRGVHCALLRFAPVLRRYAANPTFESFSHFFVFVFVRSWCRRVLQKTIKNDSKNGKIDDQAREHLFMFFFFFRSKVERKRGRRRRRSERKLCFFTFRSR
jgi:hypothetical protein